MILNDYRRGNFVLCCVFSSIKYNEFFFSSFATLEDYWLFLISFFLRNLFIICLFLAVLGLHCCAWAFSSCGERGLLFVAVHGLLIVVASLVVEHGL